jgi:8-oxo-dGTP pyrophosphatase MutT (NUDIX family)
MTKHNPNPNPKPNMKSKPKFSVREYTTHSAPKPASPSASIILISPTHEILLLHRVQTSSAFPSAHVFPGGNLEPSDGPLPTSPTDINRHLDNAAYRTGAVRELFEETGILLARENKDAKTLLRVSTETRKRGREDVHGHKVSFGEFVQTLTKDGKAVLDTDRLIPFTHWVTPPNVPKRFTTQMYVYFVGLEEKGNPSVRATGDMVETMAPEWRRAGAWLERARKGEIILFPPQFLLLFLISEVLDRKVEGLGKGGGLDGDEEVIRKREELRRVIELEGSPPWRDKFISPIGLQFGREDKRAVLALDKPGPELKDSGLKGDSERVVLVRFAKEGPRDVEVAWKKDVLEEQRRLDAKGKEHKL